jgi:hypothetical protein
MKTTPDCHLLGAFSHLHVLQQNLDINTFFLGTYHRLCARVFDTVADQDRVQDLGHFGRISEAETAQHSCNKCESEQHMVIGFLKLAGKYQSTYKGIVGIRTLCQLYV